MRGAIVGTGLLMVLASGILSYVGHYDGVLGTTPAPVAQSSQTGTSVVTVRGVVAGTPQDAARAFDGYREALVVPRSMDDLMGRGAFVPFQFHDRELGTVVSYLLVQGPVPRVGSPLVVTGTITAHWPLSQGDGGEITSTAVHFLLPTEYHAPLLFRG